MRKFITIVSILLIIPTALYAGFGFGLINAAKNTVDKVDVKVAQSRATLDTQAPTVPTNLTATTVSWTQINLSWTASTDNIGVKIYKIYRDGGTTPIATPTDVIYNDIGLTASTAYSYTVSACDAAGNCSAQSAMASATTSPPDAQAPTVPTNLTATTASSTQINLSWTASTDNVGVTGYKIYRDGGGAPIATPTGTTYNNTGLTASTLYSYTVSACDAAANCSAQSVAASATTANPPGGVFLLVPGNPSIGTSDFYVMKYEAKNVSGVATSQADVTPWVNIDLPTAIAACTALGGGAHLLTIPEAQTINRNIEAQAANWANGTIGSLVSAGGGLKRGNVGITDSASYIGSTPEYGTGRNAKASLALSNGGVIWDWSGNVWERIYGAASDGTLGTPNGVIFDMGGWYEWSNEGSQMRSVLGPSNSSWTSNYGMGKYDSESTQEPVLRGGGWSNGAISGVYAFCAGDAISCAAAAIGFRCAR